MGENGGQGSMTREGKRLRLNLKASKSSGREDRRAPHSTSHRLRDERRGSCLMGGSLSSDKGGDGGALEVGFRRNCIQILALLRSMRLVVPGLTGLHPNLKKGDSGGLVSVSLLGLRVLGG